MRGDQAFGVLWRAMRSFDEAAADPQRLLETVARRIAEIVDAYCVVLGPHG
jgi:hypothetical protein